MIETATDLSRADQFTSRCLRLFFASVHPSGHVDFSLLFSLPLSLIFSFYLPNEHGACSIDRQGFFSPCLRLSSLARPFAVCLLMETLPQHSLEKKFFLFASSRTTRRRRSRRRRRRFSRRGLLCYVVEYQPLGDL